MFYLHYITHFKYQHDESLLLNYKFLASNLTSIPIIQNFKIMHYQHTLKFASKSYFHNFRVNHTQDQELAHVIQLLKHKKITPLAFQQGAYFLFNSSLFINLVFFLPIRFYVLFYKKSIPLC